MTQLLTQVLSKYIPHYGQFAGLHPILHWKIQDVKSVAQQFIREYYSDHNHDMYTNILERRVNPCFLCWFSQGKMMHLQNDIHADGVLLSLGNKSGALYSHSVVMYSTCHIILKSVSVLILLWFFSQFFAICMHFSHVLHKK